MDKSCITMTGDGDWWLERITMEGEQRYPEHIRVGSLEDPRVYVPERTCGYPIVTDEEEMAERDRAAREGRVFSTQDVPLCRKCTACGKQFTPMAHRPEWLRYCPYCGARITDWED